MQTTIPAARINNDLSSQVIETAATIAKFKVTNILFIASLRRLIEFAISTQVCH